ncbi:MAG: methylated-DNA--[protein]-cysteine S-methyltransferase [Candidatus Eisenbacteria bacterium]|nr:methylated-DNA--[protein]-cysteine S-methyltransferase [Candidatus Eisenbacteria bacterium]
MEILRYSTIETPFGTVWFAGSPAGLSFLLLRYFNERRVAQELRKTRNRKMIRDDKSLRRVANQLTRYFQGERVPFDFDLDLSTGTKFQQSIWKIARKIPYGTMVSYKKIARDYGNTLCARAVGNALGANPIPIVIPCHRVIRADDSLGGFSSGVKWKERLIALERGQGDIKFGEPR